MGRELRRVPPDWQHPYDERTGRPIPQHDKDYDTACQEWMTALAAWESGADPDRAKYGEDVRYYWDWNGGPPNKEHRTYRERHWTPEEATAYQVYETVSEGTPVSPVFPTLDAVREWLQDQGYSAEASAYFLEKGWAPSGMIVTGAGHPPRMATGIDALDLLIGDEEDN